MVPGAWGTVSAWLASLLTCPCGKALAPCWVPLRLPSVDAGKGVAGVADGAAGPDGLVLSVSGESRLSLAVATYVKLLGDIERGLVLVARC